MGRAVPPACSTSRTAPCRPASPRASSATFAPRAAKARAVARPIPPLAPVTTTTCPPCSVLIPDLRCPVDVGRPARFLLALAGEDLPGLGEKAFLQHAPPVRIPLEQGQGGVLGLLEGGVRRDR